MVRAIIAFTLALVGALPGTVIADHNADQHSKNMSLVSTWDHDGTYRTGSDLAFWKTRAVLGNYDEPGGFRVLDIADPKAPRLLGQFKCPGPQNDVSIWDSLVFVSVDTPRTSAACDAERAQFAQQHEGTAWEGIRIVSIADPANPTQVAAVPTDCGSHTHTLVPDEANGRVLIYVSSYPLGAPTPSCSVATHRKISVIEVPLADPAAAHVVSTPDVGPVIGCHDISVFVPRKLAAAACITESQIWNLDDLENPSVVGHIPNPAINIHHSTTFSWDGNKIVIGDELGGAAASPGCMNGGHAPLGALWFYDVSTPSSPMVRGWYQLAQQEVSVFCTAHNFNAIPLRSGRDVLVSGWYNGGTTVVDFTDPTQPVQVAYYKPKEGVRAASWSSYWYNGHVYVNNFDASLSGSKSRGFDVLRIDDRRFRRHRRLGYLNPQTQEHSIGR